MFSYLSCSSPWWPQSWPCWVGGWVPLHRAGGWLAVSGSCSSGCSSVPRLSSRPLSSSPGLATSSSPPEAPSLHCRNTGSCRGNQLKSGTSFSTSPLKHNILKNCVFFSCFFWRTQFQTGRWTQTVTAGGCPLFPSHTDQPAVASGRKGCLCWPPSHHRSPLQIRGGG